MLNSQPGMNVIGSASSGREALALLDQVVPDVLLIDLRMPGISGLETMGAIKRRKDPPRIIVLTSFVHANKRYLPPDIEARLADRMSRSDLTPREHLTLQLVAKGLTNKEIGRVFGNSDETARNHVNNIIEKLDVSDRTETATLAMRQELVSLSD